LVVKEIAPLSGEVLVTGVALALKNSVAFCTLKVAGSTNPIHYELSLFATGHAEGSSFEESSSAVSTLVCPTSSAAITRVVARLTLIYQGIRISAKRAIDIA
jgi:hypothetical protein